MTVATKATMDISDEHQDEYFDRLEADREMLEANPKTTDAATQAKRDESSNHFPKALQNTTSDLRKIDKAKWLPATAPQTRDKLLTNLAGHAAMYMFAPETSTDTIRAKIIQETKMANFGCRDGEVQNIFGIHPTRSEDGEDTDPKVALLEKFGHLAAGLVEFPDISRHFPHILLKISILILLSQILHSVSQEVLPHQRPSLWPQV